jgi:hypothetical protein
MYSVLRVRDLQNSALQPAAFVPLPRPNGCGSVSVVDSVAFPSRDREEAVTKCLWVNFASPSMCLTQVAVPLGRGMAVLSWPGIRATIASGLRVPQRPPAGPGDRTTCRDWLTFDDGTET